MSISYKTPSYFSDFSCLGGDCEDTCCRNWEVKLDRKHFDLLESVMSKSNVDKSLFQQYIHFNENSISSDHDYAFIRMGVNGYCAMLDNKGLCSIHAKYGVNVLGNVCTMFPRVISRCGDTVELSGALSCPEVVRNCIDDDSPLKLQRFKTSDLPRSKNYPVQRELFDIEDDTYSEYFPLVREKLIHVMANEEQAIETRLYVLANLTHKVSDFYHRDCAEFDVKQIKLLLEDLSKDAMVTKLDSFISEHDTNSSLSLVVVHSILSIKLQQACDENTSVLYKNIINRYIDENDNITEVLADKLTEITLNIDDESKEYIDKAVTRYIINCLYREWFVSMPDPFTYVQMLLVRSSILRCLIYLDIGSDQIEMHQLRQKIVYIMYNFARNIDQNLEFLKIIYNALSEQAMLNFDFSPAFIRIS